MACLGNELRSFCHFWGCTQVLHFRLFRWLWGLLHSFYGILAHSSRYSGHLNMPFPSTLVHCFLRCRCLFLSSPARLHPVYLDSCTLIFQVHRILLSSSDTSTAECCFHFGPTASFFLGLLVVVLHSSPGASWTPSDLRDSSFGVMSFWNEAMSHAV